MKKKTKDYDFFVLIYRIVAVLFCAVMLTTHMVSGLYAKYTYTSTTNTTARVARFNILREGTLTEDFAVQAAPGEAEQFIAQINISGELEVAVNCSIDITNVTNNIPYKFKLMKLEGDSYVDVDAYSFNYFPTSDEVSYRLYIYMPEDTELPDSNLTYRGMVDYIKITVTARQID